MVILIFLVFHSFLLSENRNCSMSEQKADSLFLNYIIKIDSTAIIKEEKYMDGNSFLFLSCESDYKVRLKWMHLDDVYIVGILQNMFPFEREIIKCDDTLTLITKVHLGDMFHLIAFNKKTFNFFIFYFEGFYDFSEWECKKSMRVFDLLLFSNVFVFDVNYNHIGSFTTPFIYFDRPAKYTRIFNQKKAEIFADRLDIYNNHQYKFVTRSGFRELLDILMYYINEYPIDNENLSNYSDTSTVVKKVTSAAQHIIQ